jgi:hypothetical protein
MSELIEHPLKIGEKAFWNYPHDDIKGAPGQVTITQIPKYVRYYTYVHVVTDQGEEGLAVYDELSPS